MKESALSLTQVTRDKEPIFTEARVEAHRWLQRQTAFIEDELATRMIFGEATRDDYIEEE